jgi:hypothetical protein
VGNFGGKCGAVGVIQRECALRAPNSRVVDDGFVANPVVYTRTTQLLRIRKAKEKMIRGKSHDTYCG